MWSKDQAHATKGFGRGAKRTSFDRPLRRFGKDGVAFDTAGDHARWRCDLCDHCDDGGVLERVGPAPGAVVMTAGVVELMCQTFAGQLLDRRTGRTHRVNGSPLVLLTRQPEEAAAELLKGRDAAVWEARIDAIEPKVTP